MSDPQENETGPGAPLPQPVGEDGIVQPEPPTRKPGEDETRDGALSQTGGDDPATR